MSCNERQLRTIQVTPPVRTLMEMTQHREDRGRIKIQFSIATFNSLRYEAILSSAEMVWYFLWSLPCPCKVFLSTATTQLLGSSSYCSSWQSAAPCSTPSSEPLPVFYLCTLSPFDPFVNWTSCSVSSWSLWEGFQFFTRKGPVDVHPPIPWRVKWCSKPLDWFAEDMYSMHWVKQVSYSKQVQDYII